MSETIRVNAETLIAAERVNGTDVYNAAGERLGVLDDILIDRVSGRAVYAVMSFGGFLGMGESHHPIPWAMLKYDPAVKGYRVNLDKQQLHAAPHFDKDTDFTWTPDYGRRVDSYYRMPTLWE